MISMAGCISGALRLKKEHDNQGEIVIVSNTLTDIPHAYLVQSRFTLNLGNNDYPEFPNFTGDELRQKIKDNKVYCLSEPE